MKKNFQDIAQSLRNNAKKILESKNIECKIRQNGDLFYAGSYALDLMTWNDIDMQVVFKDNINPMDALGCVFTQIGKDPDFIEAQIIHFRGNYKPKMPRGIYLGIKMDCPDLGGLWKLDIVKFYKNIYTI